MATGNNRDVRLGVEVTTAGEDDLRRLASAVRALGNEGDPAAAEFARLGNELDRLADQSGAVSALRALRTDVELLSVAQRDNAATAAALNTRYTEQAASTTVLREAQALARAEATQARTAYDELVAALDRQIISNRAAGQSGKQLAASTEEARLRVVDQKLALDNRNRALAEANVAVSAAEAAERRLATQFDAANSAAQRSSASLLQQSAALTSAATAAGALGVEVSDLAASEQRLTDAARSAAVEATRLEAEATESAAAMRALETAARAADAQMEALAASLRETEAAARKFTSATEQAAAAGAGDVAVTQARVRAADALIASERELTSAQRELAAQRDRGRFVLIAEAQALLAHQRATEASASATRRLVRDSVALGTALDGTGRTVSRVGTLTEEAFGKTGVRSMQAIEREIADVDRAMSLLERRFRSGQVSANDLARATGSATTRLVALKREAATIPGHLGAFEKISSSISGLLSKFGALGAAVATVGIAVRPVLDASIALQQMTRVLTTVTGSAEIAAKQIEFLRVVSQQSGQQFDVLGASYAKFAASALQSGITIEQTQEVFKSVALAAGNLGLSSDQAKRALEALSQIASKGVVTMEELRQQLGDALPGVLPLLAKELGLTQQQLNKVVEAGQLLASEAIPAIGRALQSLGPQDGVVNGMVATWSRFVNVVKQAGTEIVEGPIGGAAGLALTALGGVIRDIAFVAVSASEGIGFFFRALGVGAAALAGGTEGLRGLGAELDKLANESATRIENFKNTAYGASEGVKKLGTDVAGLGSSFAKLSLDQQVAIDKAVLAAQSSEKNTQAKKIEADATNTLAGLIGDETAARVAGVAAAQSVLLATEQQLAADRAVVATLEQTRVATEKKAAAEGLGRDAIKATIEALDAKIEKATADVGKTLAQADAARAHATALELAAEAAKDNSKRIDELKKAVVEAEVALRSKILAMAKDHATSEDVKKATDALAKAKGLLRDAINDVSEALERQLAALRADAKLAEASLKLDLERAKNAEREALARGSETAARQAGLRVKELELALTRTGIDLKLQEAAAALRALDVQERELKLLGQLTPEKQAEIEVKRKTAQASVLEAEAGNEANRSKEKEIELSKLGGTARADYNKQIADGKALIEGDTAATGKNTDARGRNRDAIVSQTAALVDSATALRNAQNAADGAAADKTRNSNNAEALRNLKDDNQADLARRLASGTLSASDLTAAQSNFEARRNNLTVSQTGTGKFSFAGKQSVQAEYNEARRVLEAVQSLINAAATPTGSRTVTTPSSTPIGGTQTSSGGNINVTLNFGSSSATLHGTQAEADAFLRLLEEAKRSAGGGG